MGLKWNPAEHKFLESSFLYCLRLLWSLNVQGRNSLEKLHLCSVLIRVSCDIVSNALEKSMSSIIDCSLALIAFLISSLSCSRAEPVEKPFLKPVTAGEGEVAFFSAKRWDRRNRADLIESATPCHDAQMVGLYRDSNPLRLTILAAMSEDYSTAPQHLQTASLYNFICL